MDRTESGDGGHHRQGRCGVPQLQGRADRAAPRFLTVPFSVEIDEQLATTPAEELLALEVLQPQNIRDTLHAYQVTPLALDEFNGPRGDFYKNMFAKCPAGRPGTADEIANVAELLMSDKGAFITGADFLIDGGATASYFYGPLKPEK